MSIFLGISLSGCEQAAQAPVSRGGFFATPTYTPFQATSPTPVTPTPTQTLAPTSIPSPTPIPCLEQAGTMEKHEETFRSDHLPVRFRVYLPPCYGANPSTRYPVLYLIHGQTFGDDQWDRMGADEAADALISSAQAAPFLIVMPLERDTFEDIYSGPFEWDLIEGLLPWMDANYSTCAERSCRAIGGLSRGGAWAFRLGFLHWDLFGAIGLHSTPPFTGDPENLPGWLASIPEGQLPRMYLDTGRSDWYLVQTSRLENLLVKANVPHEWYLNNGTHNEEYWSAHVQDYIEWYSREWGE